MSSTINALTSGGGLAMAGDTSGSLQLQTNNGTTAVTIDTSQNVGIGTTSPSSAQVGPTLQLGSAAGVTNSRGNLRLAHTDTSLGNSRSFDLYVSNTDDFTIKDGSSGTVVMAVQKSTLSGNLQFNSGYGSVATAYGCRAWVNFAGASGTINASGGVSSVNRSGTGAYQINLSFTMPDANYVTVAMTSQYNVIASLDTSSPTTTTRQVIVRQTTNPATSVDAGSVQVAIFR